MGKFDFLFFCFVQNSPGVATIIIIPGWSDHCLGPKTPLRTWILWNSEKTLRVSGRIWFLVFLFRPKFSKCRYYNYYKPKRSETQTMCRGGRITVSDPKTPLGTWIVWNSEKTLRVSGRIWFLVFLYRQKLTKCRYYNYYNPKRSETQTLCRAKYTEPGMLDNGGGVVESSSLVVPMVRGSNPEWSDLNSLKFGENS